jgi:hypothetical protein
MSINKYINKIKSFYKISFHKENFRGIIMVEALMSITILMVAVMAPLTLATQSANYAKYSLNKITASYLAEEQIEMMVNLKKSFDIYCFNTTNGDCTNNNSFDEFVNNISDPAVGVNCPTYNTPTSITLNASPCYFDEKSFTYTNAGNLSKPNITTKDAITCPTLYENKNDVMSCVPTSLGLDEATSTAFTRKMYIDVVDNLGKINSSSLPTETLTGQYYNTAVKLTSWVCIKKGDCEPGSKDSMTLVSFIYK